jgi:hypothetical protein
MQQADKVERHLPRRDGASAVHRYR